MTHTNGETPVSFFSEEDRAANRTAVTKKEALDREYRRIAPSVANRIVAFMEADARDRFRHGGDVTEITIHDDHSYPKGKGTPHIPEDILSEVLSDLIEEKFGVAKDGFTLSVHHYTDYDADPIHGENHVTVRFNRPLR